VVKAPILWITGIPAAGKTTLARRLVRHFRGLGVAAEIVDGDEVRRHISTDLGFSKNDRLINAQRIAWIARLLAKNGVMAVVASVSPYLEGREDARRNAALDGVPFIEIYASCSVAIARGRDGKGIYAQKTDVTGAGSPYEAPVKPEIVVETDLVGPDEALALVVQALAPLL
jgi:adenylylsulfate kinase